VKPLRASTLEFERDFKRISIGSFSIEFTLYKTNSATIFDVDSW
jgi:hypothetical protein